MTQDLEDIEDDDEVLYLPDGPPAPLPPHHPSTPTHSSHLRGRSTVLWSHIEVMTGDELTTFVRRHRLCSLGCLCPLHLPTLPSTSGSGNIDAQKRKVRRALRLLQSDPAKVSARMQASERLDIQQWREGQMPFCVAFYKSVFNLQGTPASPCSSLTHRSL